MTLTRTLKGVLALAIVAALAVPASAQSVFSAAGTATSTNTVVTLSPANPVQVVVSNDGSASLYLALNAVATAAAGTTIVINQCETVSFVSRGGLSTLGLITAANTTASYRVFAFNQRQNNSDSTFIGQNVGEQFTRSANASCNASALLSANGAQVVPYQDSELITLATGAATTDSVGNLLHANSLIDSVVCRVTTTITTAVSWQISDPTTAGRFSATSAVMTAGATIVGLKQWNPDGAAAANGPVQSADAKLRLTMNANPGAGVVRCTVFGRTFIAPTS